MKPISSEILDRVIEELESGNDTVGFCIECGEEQGGFVEPGRTRVRVRDMRLPCRLRR